MPDDGYARSVRGLLIPRDADTGGLANALEEYARTAALLAEGVKGSLGDAEGLRREALRVSELLGGIHAMSLAAEADDIAEAATRGRADICEMMVYPFITGMLTLCIDIITAKIYAEKGARRDITRIEKYAQTVCNADGVGRLAARGAFGKARAMLEHMDILSGDRDARDLYEALKDGDSVGAATFVRDLKQRFTGLMEAQWGADGEKRKILGVDDRPEVLSAVSGVLKRYCKFLGAPGGAAALKVLDVHKPDLFLLDIEMPGMDGFALAAHIKARAEHARTPIVFLTGTASQSGVRKALEAGGDGFIVKPASQLTLLATVGRYLT